MSVDIEKARELVAEANDILRHSLAFGSEYERSIVRQMATTITALVDEVERLRCPPLKSVPNADAGDSAVLCSGCMKERDEPHSWEECAKVLVEDARAATAAAAEAKEKARRLRALASLAIDGWQHAKSSRLEDADEMRAEQDEIDAARAALGEEAKSDG